MKYKMIATDYDCTLHDDIAGISDFSLGVIREYIQAGGHFFINTGRMYSSIRPIARELDFNRLVAAYQGAAIYDLYEDKPVYESGISTDTAIELLEYLEASGNVVQGYWNDTFFVEKRNPRSDFYSEYCHVEGQYLGEKLSTFVRREGIQPMKIVAFTDAERMFPFYTDFVTRFGNVVNTARSQSTFMEMVNKTCNKGTAAKYLAETCGVRREEVMCFGDATNDNPMLQYAGLGVAVGNAMEETKAVADYVCERVDCDGVAKTILKYCY